MSYSEDLKRAADALHWIETGPREGAPVLLLHPVGLDLTYWDRQIEVLRERFRVVGPDFPGHGRSGGAPARWSFDFAADVMTGLVERCGCGPVHLVGLSFGGFVAQTLVLRRPELVRSLVLMGTAATFSEETRAMMRKRAPAIRAGGMQAVAAATMERWFTAWTRTERPDLPDRATKTLLADDPAVNAAIWEVIPEFNAADRLQAVRQPTLVMVGEDDLSTPPAMSRALAERIAGAELRVVAGASHMLQMEQPNAVNAALVEFLGAR